MRRLWTTITAAAVLAAMTLVVVWAPTDFVIWAPGKAIDLLESSQPLIEVSYGQGQVSSGRIVATSMNVTSPGAVASLGAVMFGYLSPSHDVFPRDAVYSPGQTGAETAEANRAVIELSREQAIAAGVRQAGVEVREMPKLLTVRQTGPAYQILYPDDFILEIDNVVMLHEDDVRDYIRNNKHVGDPVVFKIMRGDEEMVVPIAKLAGSSSDGTVPTVGVTVGTGYWYEPRIQLNMDISRGDVNQGLALALATYDLLTESDNNLGETVAAVGAINATGDIDFVSGINEHAMSAWRAQADLLLIPQANCSDVVDRFPGMIIAPVATLTEAAQVLANRAKNANPPSC